MVIKMFTSQRKRFASLAIVVGLCIAGTTARADPVLFDPDGGATTNGTRLVSSFGFDTGSSLARAAISGGGVIGVGSTFQLFYQTRLVNLTLPGGVPDTPAGLNGTAGGPPFEITLTASVTQVVTAVGPGTASFRTAPAQSAESFIRMWEHTSLASNNFTGAGFTTGFGPLILSAVPSAALDSAFSFAAGTTIGDFDQADPAGSPPAIFWSSTDSVSGGGGGFLGGNVTFANTDFFKSPIATVRFDAFNNTPFVSTTPSMAFNNITNAPVVIPSLGAINGISGPDFEFQSRSTAVFTVPEPASAGLLALGVLGVVGYSWRKRRQAA